MTNVLQTGLILSALLFSLSSFSTTAFALDLQDAKTTGLVGEQANGYLGVVGQKNSEINRLVADINAKRRSAYQGIATKNNTPLNAIEKLAGQKAMKKTASGRYIKVDNKWQKVR